MTDNIRKVKLLKIWDILSRETDEDHPMPTQVLIKKLACAGLACDRRTLYSDIKVLNDFGYEILCNRGISNEYYVIDRTFNIPELQILIDAVQAASFITEKKTTELIDKIAQLAGNQKAEVFKRNIVQFGTVKGSNENIYYSISEIAQAINSQKKIAFYYFDYELGYKRKYRMRKSNPSEQKRYVVNPVATVFRDDKYYLYCYDDYYKTISQYRVDRMDRVEMLEEDKTLVKEFADFDLSKHQLSLVGMFSGKKEKVAFEFDKSVLGAIYEKFGSGVNVVELENGKLKCTVEVQISNPFYAWVCGFGNKLKVISPRELIEQLIAHTTETLQNYLENTEES